MKVDDNTIVRGQERDQLTALLHDLRQYVAAGLLLYEDDSLDEDELRSRLRTGRQLFRQLSTVVDGAATSVRPPPGPVDLRELVDECVAILRHGHPRLRVQSSVRGDLELTVERAGLHRAVTNLLENAARAAGDHGNVTIQAWARGDDVMLEVGDDGRGFGQIPRGSGRGMHTVNEVVRSARGRLEIRSAPEVGTQVRLVIPAQQGGPR